MLESPESLKAFESKVGQKWAKEIIIDYYSRSPILYLTVSTGIMIGVRTAEVSWPSCVTAIIHDHDHQSLHHEAQCIFIILMIMIRTEEGWLLGPMVKILTIMAKQNPTPGGLSR